MKLYIICISSAVLFFLGCSNFSGLTEIETTPTQRTIAIPLIYGDLSVASLQQNAKATNTSLKIDADGHAILYYNGEVIRQSSSAIFPPLPGTIPYPILDTLWPVPLQFNNFYLIKKAIFEKTSIKFHAESPYPSEVKVTMQILELMKNGKTFETQFTIPYSGTLPGMITTPSISIDGWTLTSETNTITFRYVATLPDGTHVKLDNANMAFDLILFSYIDGYLGYHSFPIKGNTIEIGLFDQWKSGGFNFLDPKIVLRVENAFGLPVRSKVNKMQLTTISGNTFDLQSTYIQTGIDFNYPTFDQLGETKVTTFSFDNSNSNITELFNDKTKTITYDIEALINPDQDTTIKGFINRDSYFKVDVAVEVPLLGSINHIVLSDTLKVDLPDFDDVSRAKLKIITSNDFPADVILYAQFLDVSNAPSLRLFGDDGFKLKAAPLKSDNTTSDPEIVETFIELDAQELEALKQSKRIVITGSINTTDSDIQKPLWIYDRYSISVKIGAILDVNL